MDKLKYDKWRDSEIKTVGRKCQLRAEATLDRQRLDDYKTVIDPKTGKKKQMKKKVAVIQERKGKVEFDRLVFTVPAWPFWDK